jgi:membrane fusion protein (multidrug efflux system)
MADNDKKEGKKKHGIVFKLFWLIVIAVAVVVGGHYAIGYIVHHILYASTDDAFVEGHIVSIAPQVSGPVTSVPVDDNQRVKEGDLLFTIDARDYQAKVDTYQAAFEAAAAQAQQAEANIAAARAEADRTETDLKRYESLAGTSGVSQQELDSAKAAAIAARAGLEVAVKQAAAAQAKVGQAHADLKQAQLDLSYTTMYSPANGRIAQKHAETGSYVEIGQPLMAVIRYEVWVTANFRETQLDKIHPGQHVIISVDAFSGKKLDGRVNSIQAGTGARFSLLPPENATGNYVKVVQRVPVKITFDEPMDNLEHLGLGMSVEPDVYIGGNPGEHPWWLKLLEFLGGVQPDEGENSS